MRIKYHGFIAEISEKDYEELCKRAERYYTKQAMEALGFKEGEYYLK